MILIADSGSTKTDWVLINHGDKKFLKTIGYNPYFIDAESIYRSLSQELLPHLDRLAVTEIYFYGAGCSNAVNVAIVTEAISRCFGGSKVVVDHDMLAAARALLGREPGFAAIIGTGSNTCLYDGKSVTQNIDSLGYLLGDEGSGSYIGKKIVRDYLRGCLPEELVADFNQTYHHPSLAEVLDALYNQPLPNRYLAGYCMFAGKHKAHPYILKIVEESFNDFFNNLVSKYPGYQNQSFNCVGAVAFIFRDVLKKVATAYHIATGKIIQSPIEGLVEYHNV